MPNCWYCYDGNVSNDESDGGYGGYYTRDFPQAGDSVPEDYDNPCGMCTNTFLVWTVPSLISIVRLLVIS